MLRFLLFQNLFISLSILEHDLNYLAKMFWNCWNYYACPPKKKNTTLPVKQKVDVFVTFLGCFQCSGRLSMKKQWEKPWFPFPQHPNTYWESVLGMFLGFKYLLNLGWAVLSDEQMSNGYPFSLVNDEQMSNKVGVKHQPVGDEQLSTWQFCERDLFGILILRDLNCKAVNVTSNDQG